MLWTSFPWTGTSKIPSIYLIKVMALIHAWVNKKGFYSFSWVSLIKIHWCDSLGKWCWYIIATISFEPSPRKVAAFLCKERQLLTINSKAGAAELWLIAWQTMFHTISKPVVKTHSIYFCWMGFALNLVQHCFIVAAHYQWWVIS